MSEPLFVDNGVAVYRVESTPPVAISWGESNAIPSRPFYVNYESTDIFYDENDRIIRTITNRYRIYESVRPEGLPHE